MARVSPARMAAFRILEALARSSNTHCDDLLRAPAMAALTPADRNLTTALVMGVLRWQPALDAVLKAFVARREPLDDAVAIALRLGAWQLLGMDRIPPHAALSESVELVKTSGRRFAAGLVNAVLRRVSERAETIRLDPAAAHPGWMVERWRRAFGSERAAAILEANQQAPRATLRLGADIEAALSAGSFLTRAHRLNDGAEPPPGARIQDEGSQLIAELSGESHGAIRILDCCAAPGGKTAILADNNPQAEITACDISAARLRAMRQSFARAPYTARIHCVEADATSHPFKDDFDLILCDAPCSGTGTLARNPEIKLRLAPGDLRRQQERQLAILRSAWRVLAPGGRLIYATCSLEAEENEMVVGTFLREQPRARLYEAGDALDAMEREGRLHRAGAELLRANALRERYLQTLPGVLPCDGFFAAILGRD